MTSESGTSDRAVSSGLRAAAREAESEDREDDKQTEIKLSRAASSRSIENTGGKEDETARILRQLSSEMSHEEEKRGARDDVRKEDQEGSDKALNKSSSDDDKEKSKGRRGEEDDDEVARALRSAAHEVAREEARTDDYADDTFDGNDARDDSSTDGGGSGDDDEDADGEEGGEAAAEKNKELIQCCARGESVRIAKLLRGGGARLMCRDGHGWTPMHWAASKGHVAVMNELLDACPNNRLKRLVNAKDQLSGWTPLHVAVVAGHLNCVKLLLENSAKAYSHNSMGETPRDCIPFARATTEYKDMASALGPPPQRSRNKATQRSDNNNSNSGIRSSGTKQVQIATGTRK